MTLTLLGGAAIAFALGPVVVPHYDWVRQSISETAAQATPGAWVARTGFPLLGLAVLTVLPRVHWGRVSAASYVTFACGLLAVGVWSHEPYLAGVPFDAAEATLHSVAATAMGVAVVTAEVGAAWHTKSGWRLGLAATYLLLPIAMALHPAGAGLTQRLLFATLISHLAVTAWRAPRACPAEGSGRHTMPR